MPFIQVRIMEGVLTDAEATEMIEKVTNAVVSVIGESLRPATRVVIDDVKSGRWGIGGKPLTTADVKAIQAGKQPYSVR